MPVSFLQKQSLPVSEIETIRMQEINTAFDRLKKRDVKYRFVINMNSFT